MRWFEQYRMDWIAETLRVFGFINREHLERKFGMSTPQASNDLARFRRAHPTAMTYDMTAKRYVVNEGGKIRGKDLEAL
jgi:transposase